MREIKSFIKTSKDAYYYSLPKTITWEVTTDCNKRCSFCYHNESELSKQLHASSMVIERTLSFIKRIGISSVAITGGEPLLHPSFVELTLKLYNCVPNLTVFTNGISVDRKIINAFFEKNIYINYSFDYNDGDNFALLERLLSSFPPERLKVSMVYNGQSSDDYMRCIKRVRQIFTGEIQLNFVQFKGHAKYSRTIVANMIELSKRLIELNLKDNLGITGQYISDPMNAYFSQRKATSFGCSICNNLKIDVYGNIYPCPFFTKHEYCLGSVLDDKPDGFISNADGMYSFLKKKLYSRIDNEKCFKCKWRDLCGGGCLVCIENGNESGVNQISCEINSAVFSYINSIWGMR